MHLKPLKSLEPGKLALLMFDGVPRKCVGYIEDDGLCGWPKGFEGKRPEGWFELSAVFAGMSVGIRRAVGKSL